MEGGGSRFCSRLPGCCGRRGLYGVDRAVRSSPGHRPQRHRVWLLPFRDMLSVGVIVASFCGDRVRWRGHVMHADNGTSPVTEPLTYATRPTD